MTYDIVFVVASVVAISAALMVVLSGNPFISSLSLIANLIALATFYILLQSDFLAAAQVIVYAGAVMIMFLFVTAYLGGRADEPTRERPWWQTLAALVAAVGGVVLATRRPSPRAPGEPGVFEVERPEFAPSLQSSVMQAETEFQIVRSGAGSDEKDAG